MAQSISEADYSRKLTINELAIVRDALYSVRSKWEDIGIELLDKNETDAIKKEKSNNVGDCLTEMLAIYLRGDNPKPSWDSITVALRAKAVGESQLAQDLEHKYLSRQTVTSRQQNSLKPQGAHLVQCTDQEATRKSPGQAVDLSFPYLDTNELSPHERKDLIQKLSRDYKNILEKFAILQASVCESLSKHNISVEKIANSALSLALYKSDDVPRPLLADEQESFEEAKTVQRVFILLRKYKLISYFDYGILKHIIEIHGTDDDKCKLREYVDKFCTFCQRKVFEVPSVISGCTAPTRKIFKVLITADMHSTLTDIKAAERKIADILGLAHSVLTLHEITPGSLVLTLSIPILIANKIFPLQASQLSQLTANGFTILSDKITMDQPFTTKMQVLKEVCDSYDCIQESKKLLELCTEGSFEEVTSFLISKEGRAAINTTFEEVHEGKSALMLVCERGHISLVLIMLDGGAEVNFQQKTTGQTALHLAAKFGHLRVVRFLLAYGADPDLMDQSGTNAAGIARQEGHTLLSDELSKGKSKVNIRTQNPLQYASDKLEEVTDFILAPGLKLFHRAAKSLVGASRSNHLGSVKYIIDHARNLDINTRESDKHGWTALMWATDKDNQEMVELLLANKADPNIAAKNQWTALMLATRRGNLKIVKILLDHGADPNAQNSKGISSMSLAVYEHHTEIAMLLVHRGADVNTVEEDGNSPLSHACVENNGELVKLFCDYKANMNHQGKKGWTPLMEAACKGFKDIVEELAKQGADLNINTEAGESAIHAATVKGHVDVVRILAYYGADLNMPNKDGLTALMVAADKGYQSIVEALLEGGVDVNYKHQATGWPAIFFAAKNGRVSILKKLLERGARTELETGLKLVDVANFFKRKAIVEEIKKKPQQAHPPVSPCQHEVPGMEAGHVGVELTSFTKKDATVDELEQQRSTKTEGSHDSLDEKKSKPAIDTEMGKEQSEELDKPEVRVQDVSQPQIEQADEPESLDSHVYSTAAQEIGEEKHVEIIDSSEFTATKSEGEIETRDMPKSPDDKIPPEHELEESKDQPTVMGVDQTAKHEPEMEQKIEQPQEEPAPETQYQSGEDTSTTTQSTPAEIDNQPGQSNQDIAERAKIYEMLFQAMDQRMNVENIKKSRRRKGVSDVGRMNYSEEIEIRH